MSWTPNDSAIKVDAALNEKLKEATFEEIKEALKNAAVDQNLAHREWDESIITPNEPGTAPRGFAKTVTVNGVKHVIEGDSELALEQAETALYRQLMAQPAATTQQTTEQPRNERGQFTPQEDADRANQVELVRRTELDLRFKRGELSTEDYLRESGAFDSYLAEQGIDPGALREVSAKRFEKSWIDATAEFLKSDAGASWPGGESNKKQLSEILIAMGATDSPSVENLARAYQYMRENDLLVENPDIAYRRELQDARSAEQINAVNHKYFGTGLFNR